jgi:hypothetical protein
MGYDLCELRCYEGTDGTVVSKSAIYQVLEGRQKHFPHSVLSVRIFNNILNKCSPTNWI